MIGFIVPSLYSLSLNYTQQSAIADFHFTNHSTQIFSVYFHYSSLAVSWQRIYNTLTVNKSYNHTLSLHRLTSNFSSTTNFPWLSPTDNGTIFLFPYSVISYRHGPRTENTATLLLRGADYIENTYPVALCGLHRISFYSCIVGHVCLRSRCLATCHNINIINKLTSFQFITVPNFAGTFRSDNAVQISYLLEINQVRPQKLRKAPFSFVTSVYPFFCPHETTQLPRDGFA
jgi:hypothetical protein